MTQFVASHQRTDGIQEDYSDSVHFRENPLFSVDCNSLELMLYYDDVEFCNPLGSKRNTNLVSVWHACGKGGSRVCRQEQMLHLSACAPSKPPMAWLPRLSAETVVAVPLSATLDSVLTIYPYTET